VDKGGHGEEKRESVTVRGIVIVIVLASQAKPLPTGPHAHTVQPLAVLLTHRHGANGLVVVSCGWLQPLLMSSATAPHHRTFLTHTNIRPNPS